MTRDADLERFYEALDRLEAQLGGKRCLSDCDGKMEWPLRGVYFFFEDGEQRANGTARVVRVGTHALKSGSKTSLWRRLAQHRGQTGGRFTGGGSHRRSVFRKHVGKAMLQRTNDRTEVAATWGHGNTVNGPAKEAEHPHERAVSSHIRSMPFLWVAVPDDPSPESDRGVIERNSLRLLSNIGTTSGDSPSADWLGRWSDRQAIRDSGLWNVNHVHDDYNPEFLSLLELHAEATHSLDD